MGEARGLPHLVIKLVKRAQRVANILVFCLERNKPKKNQRKKKKEETSSRGSTFFFFSLKMKRSTFDNQI